ncbi:MAG: hypothetical protein WC390_05115 [Sulfurimonas sp.]|jgi:hypothetical protein
MNKRFDFFEITTPADLFRKIESDLADLETSSQNVKVAFNFFVSIEHLPDWLELRHLVHGNCLLRIVSHIANGAKHFNINENRHTSVTGTEKSRYIEEGYFEPGYFEEPLIIYLSETESKELGFTQIDAVALGKQVVEFWRPYVQQA